MKATVTDIAAWRAQHELTEEDLEIAEEACRANAARCRRQGAIDEAAHWERKGDNIARARTPRAPSEC